MNDPTLSFEMMQEKVVEAADFMRLFGTPGRLMLLCHITQKERSVGEIQEDLDFKQPALSQQLAELRQAGVVQTRRESRQVYYSIADDRVAVVMKMLMQVFCGAGSSQVLPMSQAVSAPGGTSPPVSTGGFLGEMAHWARLEQAD
ncbi:ArsR/SmtB family transcription factor [Rhizobium sp. ZK1]|uniref:ArsR/SmtB family transcription factor n=1 Tax=Rhizobium sp. ZK1 TaxID=3389872 RepID=UPI0039F6E858